LETGEKRDDFDVAVKQTDTHECTSTRIYTNKKETYLVPLAKVANMFSCAWEKEERYR
jgi:hypothetical protein